jgi:hypothetical protein
MAELDKLIIEISADDARFVQSLTNLKNGLADFGKQGSASADEVAKALRAVEKAALSTNDAAKKKELVDAYIKLNTELQRVKKEFRELTKLIPQLNTEQTKVSNSSRKVAKDFGEVDQAARRARIALYGTNQIVRDLPFGFIAISNNIPVALDQFQELIKETGGVDKAFKSLGGAMLGAGGLSIAFSALTSVAVTLIQEYGSLANAINTIFDLVDKDTVALIKQKDAYAAVNAEIKGETSNVSLLTATLTNAQASSNARLNSYNELKRIAPGVIQDIAYENTLTAESIGLIKNRSLELINYIQLRGRESALIKLIADEEEKGLKATQKLIRQLTGEGRTWVDTLSDVTDAAIYQRPNAALEKISKEVINASKQTQFWSKSLDGVRKQILEFDGLITGQISLSDQTKEQQKAAELAAATLKKTETTRASAQNKEVKDNLAVLQAKLAQEKSYLDTLNSLSKDFEEQQIKIATLERDIKAAQLTKQITDRQQLSEALKALEIDLQNEINKIVGDNVTKRVEYWKAEGEAAKKAAEEAKKAFEAIPKAVPDSTKIISPEQIQAFLKQVDASRQTFIENENARLQALTDQALLFANAIGNFTGDFVQGLMNGESAIDGLIDGMKKLAKEIAIAAAKAIALELVYQALNIASGGTAGTAAKKGVGIIEALRKTGRVSAPNINPTMGMMVGPGGVAIQGSVTFVQRGQDLVGVLARSNARINRVG